MKCLPILPEFHIPAQILSSFRSPSLWRMPNLPELDHAFSRHVPPPEVIDVPEDDPDPSHPGATYLNTYLLLFLNPLVDHPLGALPLSLAGLDSLL
jgi:hypothetical protein